MTLAVRALALLALGGTWASPASAQDAAGPRGADPARWGLATLADCEGPDGAAFTTALVSLPDGTVRFAQASASDATNLLTAGGGREPGRVFRHDGLEGWGAAEADLAGFLHGHDVQRLFLAAAARDGAAPERVVVTSPASMGGGEVTIVFDDLRPVLGVPLPFRVEFLHGGERHEYRFRHVRPFLLAPGCELPDDPAPLFARLGDAAEVLAVHARGLQAHRDGDVDALLADSADPTVDVGNGTLREIAGSAARERLGAYLGRTSFELYADRVAPVVSVSRDGSQAWLACEIEARGVQRDDAGAESPVDFRCSWVELLARDARRAWVRNGIASSFAR